MSIRVDLPKREEAISRLGLFCFATSAIPLYLYIVWEPRIPVQQAVVMGSFLVVGVALGGIIWGSDLGLGGLRSFSIGSWYIAKFALVFGLTSLGWITQQSGTPGIVRQSSVPLALGAAATALAVWILGYRFGGMGWLRAILLGVRGWCLPGSRHCLKSVWTPVVVYGVGLAARGYQLLSFSYGYISDPRAALGTTSSTDQLMGQIEHFCRYGLVLAAIAYCRRTGPLSPWVFRILIVVELGFALISGLKEEVLLTFLVLMLVLAILRGRVPLAYVVYGVVAAIIVFPLIGNYRERIRGSNAASLVTSEAIDSLPGAISDTFSPNDTGLVKLSSELIITRLRQIDNVALVMQRTPSQIDYEGPSAMITNTSLALIPRSLWTSKPVISYGYEFSHTYYDLDTSVYTSSGVTTPGDLYRYGGWLTIIIGMFILGQVTRVVERSFYPAGDDGCFVIYAGFFILLTNQEVDVVSLLVSLLIGMPFLLLATKYSFRAISS